MIYNRTDFYFSDVSEWTQESLPRLLAVVEAWLACPVRIHREGFELLMHLSRCRGFANKFVSQLSVTLNRELKETYRNTSHIDRAWFRDTANPKPGPVLVCKIPVNVLDEDGCQANCDKTVVVPSTDEETAALIAEHYRQMHTLLSADYRSSSIDINRAMSLSGEYSSLCPSAATEPASYASSHETDAEDCSSSPSSSVGIASSSPSPKRLRRKKTSQES